MLKIDTNIIYRPVKQQWPSFPGNYDVLHLNLYLKHSGTNNLNALADNISVTICLFYSHPLSVMPLEVTGDIKECDEKNSDMFSNDHEKYQPVRLMWKGDYAVAGKARYPAKRRNSVNIHLKSRINYLLAFDERAPLILVKDQPAFHLATLAIGTEKKQPGGMLGISVFARILQQDHTVPSEGLIDAVRLYDKRSISR